MTDRRITRRQVLGGLGTAGMASVAIAQFGSAETKYTNATVFTDEDDTPVLTIEWREQYNGQVVERASVDSETPEGELPAFVTSNVLPGDSGGVLLHMTVPPSGGKPETCLSFEMRVEDISEQGETEPERKADASTVLDEAIDATVWYDTGPFRSNVLFPCNGRRDPGERVLASGPLAAVTDTLSGSSSPVEVSCLTPSNSLCLGFDWHLDESVSNAVQSDRVTVAFDVVIESSGGHTHDRPTDDAAGDSAREDQP
ncbi:hypothetical protein EGH21_15005 [Halomicroarcula sp. F13]|uniref:Ribosomally synthesized peptide with SipW-like signal peptide n=1 Tax=Haloarcula rubra TaxID=2487747 RepID=A0AAW4PVS5_9EURY|nr:hypothetical protein [Halomicroarcula rubra]MBX0324337.1 hypothetical protein [Halomicroarcula rubra]